MEKKRINKQKESKKENDIVLNMCTLRSEFWWQVAKYHEISNYLTSIMKYRTGAL
jgi:hypothetical protein